MTRGARSFLFRDFYIGMCLFASGGFQGGLAPPAPVNAASGDRMCQDVDPAIVRVWLGGAATILRNVRNGDASVPGSHDQHRRKQRGHRSPQRRWVGTSRRRLGMRSSGLRDGRSSSPTRRRGSGPGTARPASCARPIRRRSLGRREPGRDTGARPGDRRSPTREGTLAGLSKDLQSWRLSLR